MNDKAKFKYAFQLRFDSKNDEIIIIEANTKFEAWRKIVSTLNNKNEDIDLVSDLRLMPYRRNS